MVNKLHLINIPVIDLDIIFRNNSKVYMVPMYILIGVFYYLDITNPLKL